MSTSVTPENLSSQSTPEPTQPTPPNPGGSNSNDGMSARERELVDQLLREQNAKIAELTSELTKSREAPAPTRNVEEERKRFYDDPVGANQDLIRSEMDRALRPFQRFVERQEKEDATEMLIARAKSDPRFANRWDDSVERYVRANISQLNPLNENSFQLLVVNAFGLQNLNMLPGQTSMPAAPAPRNSTITPPSIPVTRSVPDTPMPNNEDVTAGLSELELKLARERGMTPKDYKAWRDLDPKKVTTSTIGKPAPSGGK